MLAYLYQVITESNKPGITIYADIEGAKVNGGTVPPSIVITSQRPDMVIVNKNTTPPTVYLLELTCPFTRNIAAANSRKRARYEFLAADIQEAGLAKVERDLQNLNDHPLPSTSKHEFAGDAKKGWKGSQI